MFRYSVSRIFLYSTNVCFQVFWLCQTYYGYDIILQSLGKLQACLDVLALVLFCILPVFVLRILWLCQAYHDVNIDFQGFRQPQAYLDALALALFHIL